MTRQPGNKKPQMKRSRLSKPEKLRILAKHTGIPEYNELAKIVEQSKKARNKREGIDARAHAHQKIGTIGPLLHSRRRELLDVRRYMENPFKQLRKDQPKWRAYSKGWDLFYENILPHIQLDVNKQPLLRSALLERKIIQQIHSTNQENGPISVGDIRYCLANAKRMYARRLFILKGHKKSLTPREYYQQETDIRRKMASARELYTILNDFHDNQKLNARQLDYIPVGVLIEEALQGNEEALEGLVGEEETKQITAAEYTARQSMKLWAQGW